jgi:hypothetical protein
MNLIPFQGKLHPKLRFSSLSPLPDREGLGLVNPIALAREGGDVHTSAATPGTLGALGVAASAGRSASTISAGVAGRSVDVALAEIAALTHSTGDSGKKQL